MRSALTRALMIAMAAAMVLGALDPASARTKKKALSRPPAGPAVTYDIDGTPIIMRDEGTRGLRWRERPPAAPEAIPRRADRGEKLVVRPRGSSTLIPPPVPSPNGPNSPPSPVLLQQPPPPYTPPPIQSFGDRATQCLHSFPLAGGVGNNPSNRDAYVRSCAN